MLSNDLAPLVAAVFLCLAWPAQGETLDGEVVGLADGDTVTVLDASRRQHKVRLAAIDAPEKRQPFGDRSRQELAALVFRKRVSVEWRKRDRHGRIVGIVKVSGRDAGLAQVRNGLAWHYKVYESEQSVAERALYALAEEVARAEGRGLWRDRDAQPPWTFRRKRESGRPQVHSAPVIRPRPGRGHLPPERVMFTEARSGTAPSGWPARRCC